MEYFNDTNDYFDPLRFRDGGGLSDEERAKLGCFTVLIYIAGLAVSVGLLAAVTLLF